MDRSQHRGYEGAVRAKREKATSSEKGSPVVLSSYEKYNSPDRGLSKSLEIRENFIPHLLPDSIQFCCAI